MSAGRGHSNLGSVALDLVAHSRRLARLRIDNLHVRNIDPGFFLDNPAAAISRRLLMTLDHARTLDLHFAGGRRHGQHAAALSSVAPGDHDHLIALSNFCALLCFHDQITSGASDTIFIKFLSRSSRATGPNTRVPMGVPSSLINTAAFWSNLTYVPSARLTSLRVRTITASCTVPFFMVPSGEASLTVTLIRSPRLAILPVDPPIGMIISTRLAPELSATSSEVCIWITVVTSDFRFLIADLRLGETST